MAKTSRGKPAGTSTTSKTETSRASGRALGVPGVEWTRATVLITFSTDAQLIRKLRALLELLESGSEDARVEKPQLTLSALEVSVAVAGQCLDILTATQIIVDALQGKPFEPKKTLGETFLSPNERDAFRDRVRTGVIGGGCSIELTEIPNGAGTKQIEVRDAIKQRAK